MLLAMDLPTNHLANILLVSTKRKMSIEPLQKYQRPKTQKMSRR